MRGGDQEAAKCRRSHAPEKCWHCMCKAAHEAEQKRSPYMSPVGVRLCACSSFFDAFPLLTGKDLKGADRKDPVQQGATQPPGNRQLVKFRSQVTACIFHVTDDGQGLSPFRGPPRQHIIRRLVRRVAPPDQVSETLPHCPRFPSNLEIIFL